MFISGCVFDWFNWFRDIPKNIGESLIQGVDKLTFCGIIKI